MMVMVVLVLVVVVVVVVVMMMMTMMMIREELLASCTAGTRARARECNIVRASRRRQASPETQTLPSSSFRAHVLSMRAERQLAPRDVCSPSARPLGALEP